MKGSGSDPTVRRPCVVLIPGLLCDREIWASQEMALKQRYDVMVLGFMRFSTIEAMAEEVLRVGPPAFFLAGHSMGGRVALEVVNRAPRRVEGLALIDTGFQAARVGEEAGRYALAELAEREGMGALARAWLPPMLAPDRAQDAPLFRALTAMVERADTALFRLQINALLTRPNAEPTLGSIGCPTCVIVGRDDSWSPVEQHRALAACIPDATLEIIEHCGHMSLVEQPDVVTSALLTWLDRSATLRADQSNLEVGGAEARRHGHALPQPD
jgi:pimeloyl-ACP methyl ester carboxylesterase